MEKDQRDDVSMYHTRGKFRRTCNRPVKTGWKNRIAEVSVMTESPDSMAYTAGLYMGENIRLYYRPGEETDRPVCVLTVELREDDANGPVLCDLLSYKEFDLKSMENFCLRRYNLIRTAATSASGWRIFSPEVSERRISPACSGKGSWPTDSRIPCPGGTGQACNQGTP